MALFPGNRWNVAGLLCLGAALGWPHARGLAQYDPLVPEPVTRLSGSVLLHGGGEVSAELRGKFIELSGEPGARVLVLVSGEEEKAAWRGIPNAELLAIPADAPPPLGEVIARLAEVRGAWFGEHGVVRCLHQANKESVESLAVGLRELIARGGVVGASHDSARWLGIASEPGAAETARTPAGLAVVPDTMVVAPCQDDGEPTVLTDMVTRHPGNLGIGVPPGTTLVLRHRSLEVLRGPAAILALAPSANRALRIDRLEPGRRADWVALCRAARARHTAPFPPANPKPPQVASGSLMIVGGGSLSGELIRQFLDLAGGPDSPIVFIPCEERESLSGEPRFVEELRRAGALRVNWLHTKDRRRADEDESLLARLREARGVWLGGGRQWNFVDSYQHTTVHRLLHDVLARGGVIGGSSAGASIQGEYMPRGDPLGNTVMMAEGYEQGLGFLMGAAIDQHFTQRKRLPDLQNLVRTFPQLLGIGIDEGTALVVQGSVGQIRGAGTVSFVSLRDVPGCGEPQVLATHSGQAFDLVKRRLQD